ncbi:MAG: hypothetical protein AAF517_27755, partial [Planctomycetota bacterium]
SGRELAVACADRTIRIYDTLRPNEDPREIHGHTNEVTTLAWAREVDLLASNSWDGTIRLWNPSSGQLLVNAQGGYLPLEFTASGTRLVIQSDSGGKLVWEVAPGAERIEAAVPGIAEYLCPAFLDDGRHVATVSRGRVRIFDGETGRFVAKLPHSISATSDVAVVHDGSIIFQHGRDLVRWPVRQRSGRTFVGPPRTVRYLDSPSTRLSITGDRKSVVATSGKSQALLFPLADPQSPRSFDHLMHRYVAISPDARWLATSQFKNARVRVFEVESGQVVAEFDCPFRSTPTFSPDSSRLVCFYTESNPEEYRVWSTKTWKIERTILCRTGARTLGSSRFSPDGSMLAICLDRRTAGIVNPDTGELIATLETPGQRSVGTFSFSSDGNRLATASSALVVWNLGKIRTNLRGLNLDWNPPSQERRGSNQATRFVVLSGEMDGDVSGLSLEDFDEALREHESDLWIRTARARLLYEKGETEDALTEVRSVIEDADEFRGARELHAQILARTERGKEALAAATWLVEHPRDDKRVRRNTNSLAWLLATGKPEVQDPERALRLVREALIVDGTSHATWNTYGVA